MRLTFVVAAFLFAAAADSGAPESNAPPAAGSPAGAILMPVAGVPDSRVAVYPVAGRVPDAEAAAFEQLKMFAAMFHAADPAVYREFHERWLTVEAGKAGLGKPVPASGK